MNDPRFAGIDWSTWEPKDRATLLLVIDGDSLLLMRKKRGLGAGKITLPGGMIEPGETPLECAIRETREEVTVEPLDVRHGGTLRFQFTDGYRLHVEVFSARGCQGEVSETDEAIPLWVAAADPPYGEMWADDELWLPHLLAGRHFRGDFLFDGERMAGQELAVGDRP